MAEMSEYKYQLSQIEESLKNDPENEELLQLKKDLKELISLTEQVSQDSSTNHQNNKRERKEETDDSTEEQDKKKEKVEKIYEVGEVIEAKWKGDGKYYDARIESSLYQNSYSVTFLGYGNTELVSKYHIRQKDLSKINALNANQVKKLDPVQIKKKQLEQAEGEVKKKKKQTLEEHWAKKQKEQQEKQSQWQNFQKKAMEKKMPGLKSHSDKPKQMISKGTSQPVKRFKPDFKNLPQLE